MWLEILWTLLLFLSKYKICIHLGETYKGLDLNRSLIEVENFKKNKIKQSLKSEKNIFWLACPSGTFWLMILTLMSLDGQCPLSGFLSHLCCQVCHCPLCKKTFQKRPDLQINRTLREITEQFRSMKKGRGLGKKTGGRGDGDIRDFFFDAFRKKRPQAPIKVPTMVTCEDSEGKFDWDHFN